MFQVLLNLLSNAIKFTSEGFVAIRAFREGAQIVVEVEDSGKGIPEAKRERIFEPFEQVDAADAGTGLGLVLVKKMCEAMEIDLELESAEGKGSLFRLRFQDSPPR